jgi:hypothetical protein
MAVGDSDRVQAAQKLVKTDPRKAEAALKEITSKAPRSGSDAATREYEAALISLGQLYRDEKSVPTRHPAMHSDGREIADTQDAGRRRNWWT